jgi:Fic family protein/DNA-binding XRE family transcriptional regulator
MQTDFKNTIKQAREAKEWLVREVAEAIGVDSSLLSRFETGTRKPSKAQVIALANFLGIDEDELVTKWIAASIMYIIENEELGYEAFLVAEPMAEYLYNAKQKQVKFEDDDIRKILLAIDTQKKQLNKLRKLDSYKIAQALELEYTYESNKIEGNTLTLQETDVVINEGITIAGKSMQEHLEAINHNDAIDFVKSLMQTKFSITETTVLQIHNLVLRGIDGKNAGKYRSGQVMIKGSKHMPAAPFLVAKQMEDLFIWYNENKRKLHPVLLAAEMHERLVTIHPFVDGNGRTSRLLMNLILLQHGFVIANIKGDITNRLKYYAALEKCQVENTKKDFLLFIAQVEQDCLKRYIDIIDPKQ